MQRAFPGLSPRELDVNDRVHCVRVLKTAGIGAAGP